MWSLLNRNAFPQCLRMPLWMPRHIDPKLEERNGGCESREDCDTPLFVEQHGGTWCEAMKKTSNIIFFVRTNCCKLRNILGIRSAVDERPWVKTQLIYALSHRSALRGCTLAN